MVDVNNMCMTPSLRENTKQSYYWKSKVAMPINATKCEIYSREEVVVTSEWMTPNFIMKVDESTS